MIVVFSMNQKVVFCFDTYFLKNFGVCLQPNISYTELGYSKHQRLDGLAFIKHRKLSKLSSNCLHKQYSKINKLLVFGKTFQ